MKREPFEYAAAFGLLCDLIEFGPWLGGLFIDPKPWFDRSKVAGKDQDKIKNVVNVVNGLFYQMADDRKIPQERLTTRTSLAVQNGYRTLKECVDADLVNLLSTNADLQPLKSMVDAVCMAYAALSTRDINQPQKMHEAVIDIFDEMLIAASRLGVSADRILVNFPSLKEIPAKVHAPIAEPTYEPVMLQIQSALPSPEQTRGMNRAALMDLLASPEAATALKALGYTTVGPTLPLSTLRGLVEALRAATAEPKPEPEPEPVFTNESNVVKAIYGEVSRLKIKDLVLAHSPFEWPNGFLVEWRGWVEHSGTPHYIQVVPNSGVLGGPPGIHVNLIARANGGPVQVGSMSCRPDLRDFMHAAATLYAGALDQLGVNRATIKASPGSFAQDVSTATPLGPWDDAPEKDGFDPLDYPPF